MAWNINQASGSDLLDTSSDTYEGMSDTLSTASTDIDSTSIDVHIYNGEETCLLKDVINRFKSQFKGCLKPNDAIKKKNIFPTYLVSRRNNQWVCADKKSKAQILVPVFWVKANIIGFFQY